MMRNIAELVSLEMAFSLCRDKGVEPHAILAEMAKKKVDPPAFFNTEHFPTISNRGLSVCWQNICLTREELVTELSLSKMSVPLENELLWEWQTNTSRGLARANFGLDRKELDPNSRVEIMGIEAWAILRDIYYTHKLPLGHLVTLWASYYVLVMGRPLEVDSMISQTTMYSNMYRLHLIDQVIKSEDFSPWIKQLTPHGFMRLYYSSSGDSEFFKINRHVVIVSTNAAAGSTNSLNFDPSFRHVTSSVNMFKSSNAEKNAETIIKLFDDLEVTLHYGGGCNDNAGDAQK